MKIRCLGIYITVIAFLLPLKFGSLAAMTEAAGFFPADPFSYLIISWPAHALGWLGGIGLIWGALVLPLPDWKSPAVRTALGTGLILPLVALTAWGRGDPEFTLGEISHLWGMGAWILSASWLVSSFPQWRYHVYNAITIAVLILGFSACRQYFFGFDEMRDFVAQQQEKGIEVSKSLYYKLNDTRVYATMVSCNALAGYLLLTLPLALWQLFKWAEKFEPVKLSRWIFLSVGGILGGGGLILTRSRGALLAVLAVAALAAFSSKISRKWKMIGAAALVLILIGGIFFAYRFGRGFGSMAERADYLRSSALMIKEQPLAGHGWGEFFYFHMREKLSSTDESARDPHNLVASFATATGIWGGIISLIVLIYPLLMLWKDRFNGREGIIFWSGTAFAVHSLIDSHLQIPALLGSYGILLPAVLSRWQPEKPSDFSLRLFLLPFVIAVSGFAIISNYWWIRGEYAQAQLWSQLLPSTPAEREIARERSTDEIYLEAIRLRPYSTSCRELLGDWHFKENNFSEAKKYYMEALKLNSRRPGIWRRLAEIELRAGSPQTAKEYMIKANGLFPRNPKYFLN